MILLTSVTWGLSRVCRVLRPPRSNLMGSNVLYKVYRLRRPSSLLPRRVPPTSALPRDPTVSFANLPTPQTLHCHWTCALLFPGTRKFFLHTVAKLASPPPIHKCLFLSKTSFGHPSYNCEQTHQQTNPQFSCSIPSLSYLQFSLPT